MHDIVWKETYDIGGITLDGEDDGRACSRAYNSTNAPEQSHAVEHLAETFASLVAQIEALAELGAAGAINTADVLNVRVDARAQGCALWQRGDTAWSWDAPDAEDVEEEQLDANGKQHGGRGHSEDADRGVVGTCAAGWC